MLRTGKVVKTYHTVPDESKKVYNFGRLWDQKYVDDIQKYVDDIQKYVDDIQKYVDDIQKYVDDIQKYVDDIQN